MTKKLITVVLAVLTLALFVGVKSATAAEMVGKTSHTVNWNGLTPHAHKFQLYFGETSATKTNAVVLESNSREVTLNYLKGCATYFWNLKYQRPDGTWGWTFSRDQVFKTTQDCPRTQTASTMMQPNMIQQNVRGATTNTYKAPTQYPYRGGSAVYDRARDVLGVQEQRAITNPVASCTTSRRVVLSWTGHNLQVSKYHVLYGTRNGIYEHSVRDLDRSATRLQVGALNTCHTYFFEVVAIGVDGRATWIQPQVTNL